MFPPPLPPEDIKPPTTAIGIKEGHGGSTGRPRPKPRPKVEASD